MIHFLISLTHPLRGDGYQFWSGIGGDVFLLSGCVIVLRHINCNEKGCYRLGHRHPDHGQPVCRKHYKSHADPRPEPK